jgi:GNAT superfamily N-acetyltransferase
MSANIRRMEERDVAAGLRLTQGQNWSHRLADWEFHFRLGRGWVACDDDDRAIGSAMWWAYGEALGTVGLIVVDPAYQGRGIGAQLVKAVLDDAGASRTMRLIATQAGFKLYQRFGFRERGGIEQHQGTVAAVPPVAVPMSIRLRDVVRDDLPTIASLDATATGGDRRAVIRALLDVVAAHGRATRAAVSSGDVTSSRASAGDPTRPRVSSGAVVAERDGNMVGFALMRESGRGALVGPVIAPDDELATVLVSQLVSRANGFVRIDVPTDATGLRAWLDSIGMPSIDHVTPMIRGATLASPRAARVFALTSQALG